LGGEGVRTHPLTPKSGHLHGKSQRPKFYNLIFIRAEARYSFKIGILYEEHKSVKLFRAKNQLNWVIQLLQGCNNL
jgi:hypothetical protein